MSDSNQLVRAIEDYAAKHGIIPTRVTRLALNDSDFYYRLKSGTSVPRERTLDRLKAFMADESINPKIMKSDRVKEKPRIKISDLPPPPVTPMDPEMFDLIMGTERLLERVQRYYGRVAERRKCSLEAAMKVCNYSPAQLKKMCA